MGTYGTCKRNSSCIQKSKIITDDSIKNHAEFQHGFFVFNKFVSLHKKAMSHSTLIELLSPAKNTEIGIEAIKHGADAIYIGAPKFGARQAAGNTIEDIQKLAGFAHIYGAKVLVTLNTILTDKELNEAEKLIHQLYEAGVDALIVQDMGILSLDLPPIRLHASTQADNRTPERVKFLQDVGFSRVVLARELGIEAIRNIRQQTDVELEACRGTCLAKAKAFVVIERYGPFRLSKGTVGCRRKFTEDRRKAERYGLCKKHCLLLPETIGFASGKRQALSASLIRQNHTLF